MKIITIKDLQPQQSPGNGWFHIEAAGEHVNYSGEEPVIQVLDREAMRLIAKAGVPPEGLLVDKDHLSRDMDKTTEAMGWVRELAVFADEFGDEHLAARIEWTELGRPLIAGGVYKHFSTEYLTEESQDLRNGRKRPTRLVGLALTNRPNNDGQRPITNRDRDGATNQTNHQDMEELKQIAAKLGLGEEATLDDILAELDLLKKSEEEAAMTEAETLINSEGLNNLGDKEKEDLKEELVCNRERGLRLLNLIKNSCKPPVEGTRNYGGKAPSRTGADKKATGGDKAKVLCNRANELQRESAACGNRISFWKALAQAKRELGSK